MEAKKKTKGWLVLVLVLAALLLFAAAFAGTFLLQRCTYEQQQSVKETPIPTDTPAPTEVPSRIYDAGAKPAFLPETSKLGMSEQELLDYGEENLAIEYWIDLTPEELRSLGVTVIRHIGLGYSYLVQDGSYYRLGEGEDGKGVLDAVACDLDMDERMELLYTYHFGTGEDAQTKVGWFHLSTMQDLHAPFSMQNGFLALHAEDGRYLMYRTERFVEEDGTFSLRFTEPLGEVMETEGGLYLVLFGE